MIFGRKMAPDSQYSFSFPLFWCLLCASKQDFIHSVYVSNEELTSFLPLSPSVKGSEGSLLSASAAGTALAAMVLVRKFRLPLLHSQARWHTEPSMGADEKWVFSLISESCCCLWLWKTQFSCNRWMLKGKNRRRDTTDSTKTGRWNYTYCV